MNDAHVDDPWDDTETRALCADDPHLEGVRQLLLTLEGDAHKRGWDHPDNQHRLFEVIRGPDLFALRMAEVLQEGLDLQCGRRDGNVGLALLDIAQAVKEIRRTGGDPGRDLYSPEFEDTEVYGWGLLAETWMLYRPEDETPEQQAANDAASAEHRLNEHPDRIEARFLQLVCRDGMHWTVIRQRGGPARALVEKPESLGMSIGGNVPYGLGRMLDAIVANPVPVPPRGEDFWKQQGR